MQRLGHSQLIHIIHSCTTPPTAPIVVYQTVTTFKPLRLHGCLLFIFCLTALGKQAALSGNQRMIGGREQRDEFNYQYCSGPTHIPEACTITSVCDPAIVI